MQTAGSDKIISPTPDGPTVSEDSPILATENPNLPVVLPSLPVESVPETFESEQSKKSADLTDSEKEQAGEAMEYMGITKAHAEKIFKAAGGGKMLRRGTAANLGVAMGVASMENNLRAQRYMLKMVRSKTTKEGTKNEAFKYFAAVQQAMARLCEEARAASQKIDETDSGKANTPSPSTVNVNINAMPPVAQAQISAGNGAPLVELGNGTERR